MTNEVCVHLVQKSVLLQGKRLALTPLSKVNVTQLLLVPGKLSFLFELLHRNVTGYIFMFRF